MNLAMVLSAKKLNLQRLAVIGVVHLNFSLTTNLTWLFYQLAINQGQPRFGARD